MEIQSHIESLDNSLSTPKDITFASLQKATNDFSDEHKIGSGGYGHVYKGVLENGKEIAVKKLHDLPGLENEHFKNEFYNLMRIEHQNIVQFVGYCYETRRKLFKLDGSHVFVNVDEIALCFEYMRGGSLDKHLSDESCGFDWQMRYKIIKGICDGLNYLHNESIYHLDLKPGNILLDDKLIPKIGDFGLSRLFDSSKTYITKILKGTINYMPPEYILKRHISDKYDIFSLGVVIVEIMAGQEGFSKYGEMSPQEFIDLVHNNWRKRIESAQMYAEVDCMQVERCIKLAIECLETEKGKRPTIGEIMQKLKQIDATINGTMEGGGGEGEDKDDKSREPVVAKFGPFGGNAGTILDIKVAPYRLKSVRVYSGALIDSIEFSYIDHRGHQHNVGPWGGPWLGPGGYTIELQPSEYLMEIHSIVGSFASLTPSTVVKSLTFVTNEDKYTFGYGGEGKHFRTPTMDNYNIVGLFVRATNVIHAIGVYMSPIHPKPDGRKVIAWHEREEEEK